MNRSDPFVWLNPEDAVFVASCREALKIERGAYAAADAERKDLARQLFASADWRPMSTVREVRDGRPVLLRLETKLRGDKALRLHGGVVAHWFADEREWMLATDWDDLSTGSGWGLIDDDFSGWRPFPDLSTDEMRARAKAEGAP